MAAVPEGRSQVRIKRKPPPAFPYSAKYPLPDPTDPFAPLQVLRQRAHSSHSHVFLNHSNTSLVPSPPSTTESDHFGSHLPSDLPSLPRAVVHPSRSIEAFDHLRDGYHSDNTRPPRPPRARTRPLRDSKSYFSDADISSMSPLNSNHRHQDQDQDQHPSDKLTERQYHYRRRSQTLPFFPPPLAQVHTPAQEPERPTIQNSSLGETPHHTNQTFHSSQNQYVYDDRQSHGHVYGQVHGQVHESHPTFTVDAHCHSHLQLSVQSGPTTPPMTPDDTLTDRSDSVLSEVPPPPPKHVTIESNNGHSSLGTGGRIERELSKIRTSDFPALLGKSEPDSPPPLPVPPPRPRQPTADSEPEQEYSSRRRSGFGYRDRKDSITKRLRRSSLLTRGRKSSDPSPPSRTRLPLVRDSIFGSTTHGQMPNHPGSAEVSTSTARNSFVPEVLRASGASGDPAENKKVKMSHRKSLSHVSLGVTPLPNVSFGPTASPTIPVENVSMTSTLVAYTDGDEFGGPAPPYPASSQPQPPVVQPRPQHHSQTVAQALDLTPLPPKDAPLPPIRKDARLPTPPHESLRSSRVPAPVVVDSEHDWRRDLQPVSTITDLEDTASGVAAHTSIPRPLTPIISGGRASEMEMDEVVLMRSSRFQASSEYAQEQSSPSPPLLANSLLVRPTSAVTAVSIPPSVPLVTPAPISPQINVPVISVSYPPVRPELGPRRGSTPPPPPPRRGPSPPAPRRAPSPLPPPRDELGPPTPAPLPLSPPRRMDAELSTPLPQPPPPPAPRARSPVHLSTHPEQFSPAPAPAPARPRSPEPRQRKSQERRSSDEYQDVCASSYLPVAQVRPPPPAQPESQPQPQSSGHGNRSRTKVPHTGIPYNSLKQWREQGASPSVAHTQLPFRPTSPSTHQHTPPRAQSPQHIAVVRMQPSISAPVRAQSPHTMVVTSRAQSPPPFRAQSPVSQAGMPVSGLRATRPAPPPPPPPPSSYNTHSHGHMQARSFPSQPSSVDHDLERERERERDHGSESATVAAAPPPISSTTPGYSNGKSQSQSVNGAMSSDSTTSGQPPYAASAESTPLPLPNTPSTTFSYPYRAPGNTHKRARSSHGASGSAAEPNVKAKPRTRATNVSGGGDASRRHHRSREEPSVVTFDEHAGLTKDQIQKAATLTIIAQTGVRMQFGDLFRERKTIVIFIRHFWCAMCQDYMYSIAKNVDYEALKRANIDMAIIGNGSPAMIKSYRNIFRTSIAMYTDPTLRLYAALGMTLRNNDPGPDAEKGEYVRHGPIGGLAMVVRNALRVGMPVWEKGGDATQLGGEFVIGPGFNCTYAHRMTTTRSHAPIREVLRATGYHRAVSAVGMKPEGLNLSLEEEDAWMEGRRRSFARMRAKREKRREIGTPADAAPELYEPELGYGSDTGSGSVSVNGSWASSVEKDISAAQGIKQQERSHDRSVAVTREHRRRGSKGLHVSNPDDSHLDHHDRRDRHGHHKHHGTARVHVAHHDVSHTEWSGGTPTLAYINQYGRRDDGYETEDGALGYNYRQD